jgi:hypothetical protein
LRFAGNSLYASSSGKKTIIATMVIQNKVITQKLDTVVYQRPEIADEKFTSKVGTSFKKVLRINSFPDKVEELNCFGLPDGIQAVTYSRSLVGTFTKTGIYEARCYANNGLGMGKPATLIFDIKKADYADMAVNSFTDIKQENPYNSAIGWAFSTKLVAECKTINKREKKFCPNGTVKVYEYIDYLYKLHGSPKIKLSTKSVYSDLISNKSTSYKAAVWARQKGIYKGIACAKAQKCYYPNKKVTKAMAVNFLYAFSKHPKTVKTKLSVSDVAKTSVTAKALTFFGTKKVLITANKFYPNQNVKRGYLVALLYSFIQTLGKKAIA